jgi:transcriptional regulator with XRE-family HTH domain
MLPEAKVREAERLLATGELSQRKIARAIGISRATISAIAAGRRPDYEARRQARLAELEPLGPLMRCPGCGGLGYSPCRLCRARKVQDQEREARRLLRRKARERALLRLLLAVKRAAEKSIDAGDGVLHFPPAPARGASDCK